MSGEFLKKYGYSVKLNMTHYATRETLKEDHLYMEISLW